MATPFSAVFDVFLSHVTDYNFLNYTQAELETILTRFMLNATPKFIDCKTDLNSKDDTLKQFNQDLTPLEIQIVGTMMVIEWLEPLLNNVELARQALTDKDFKIYSQANHIKQLDDMKQTKQVDIDGLMIRYTYNKIGLEELR